MAVNLWDKGVELDPHVRAFTAGEDAGLDQELLPWDLLGSAAHARMLESIGALSGVEADALTATLAALLDEWRAGGFRVGEDQEDGHTAIEVALTQHLGDLGKRIHLGRSRNDQVTLMLRLRLRDAALEFIERLAGFVEAQCDFITRHGAQPMPGYTHLQAAMPSTLGLWAQAWIEASAESMRALRFLYGELNRCPLGAAAGFGSPVATDRDLVAKLLGFERPQRSVVDVIHSRARLESRFLGELVIVAGTLEKFAWDLTLFLTREFGFLELAPAFRTGSSIMPQKQNPDPAEVLRARASRLRGIQAEHAWVAAKLPSNYHRDLQFLKGPMMRALAEAAALLEFAPRLTAALSPRAARLDAAMSGDLDAARRASEAALGGTPFRDAYRAEGSGPAGNGASSGAPGHVLHAAAAEIEASRAECASIYLWAAERRAELDHCGEALLGAGWTQPARA